MFILSLCLFYNVFDFIIKCKLLVFNICSKRTIKYEVFKVAASKIIK